MGFTYAVQVPVGRELDVKVRLMNALERLGNPGIIAVHALETFEQLLSDSGMSHRQWRARVPGYIFVTVERAAGLGMAAECWQLIKHLPLVRKILNCYIQQDEWKDFFENVDLEPEIQIVVPTKDRKPSQKELKDYWSNLMGARDHAEPTSVPEATQTSEGVERLEQEESPFGTFVEAAVGVLKERKDQAIATLHKVVAAIETTVVKGRTVHTIPFTLYRVLLTDFHKKAGGAKSMNVQSALHELTSLLKAVMAWRT